jgi:hypothetical protein
MAKRNPTAANIDWYLISIDRLKQIGLVVVLLLLAAAGVWFWREQKGNPKTNAETAIAEARQALNSLAASTEYNAHRAEFNRAQQKLDEARNHFNASRYAEAQTAAVESGTISNTARTGGGAVDNDAQFLAVEGDVKVQKGSSSEWRDADLRTPLFNGDWVKTGDRSSAELIFSSNGSLYTIGSNALLEIYATLNPGSTKKTNSVTVKVGPVEVATSKDTSTVRTPGTQVIVESDSTTQVNVNEQQASSVIATRGNASVAPEAGGAGVRLSSGEKVTATPVGAVSAVRKVAPSPLLLSPADGQSFQLSPELNVQLLWNPPEAGANGYILQVSRSRLFSTLEINARRTRTGASTKVTAEGAFYWRVASIGADGEQGPFSQFRRFRVVGGGRSMIVDAKPPKLVMKKPFLIGSQFYIISGTTEPGATVFVNDEEADVDSKGGFQKLVSLEKLGQNTIVIKAVNASGATNVQNQTVIVQE